MEFYSMKLQPTEEQLDILEEEEQACWINSRDQALHMFNVIAPMVLEAAEKELHALWNKMAAEAPDCIHVLRRMKGTE